MQYFLGYPSFISEKPFDATLFVEIRKRLSLDVMNAINETIVKLMTCFEEKKENANRKSEASTTVAPLEKGDTQPVKKIGQAETEASVTNASLENNDTQAEKVSSQEQAKENGQSELSEMNTSLEKEDTLPGKQSSYAEPPIVTATEEKDDDQKDKPASNRSTTSESSDHTATVETKETAGGQSSCLSGVRSEVTHKGVLLLDATVCPQDIAFPTDLDLLSSAREKSEELIDSIYDKQLHGEKPRTYRKIARKEYLRTAQKKKKTKKQIRNAVRKQLGYLCRNIRSINLLLDKYPILPFDKHERKYFYVIQTVYVQQLTMYKNHVHTIEDRIVSIHQPHVRPIVRGKTSAPVEFGSKISVSLIDGISFIDELSWDAFNEGARLLLYIEKYRKRFGFYPRIVMVDKIYCTRENRMMLKEKGIILRAKPLGRPSTATALSNHVSPGERNPIEGKFG